MTQLLQPQEHGFLLRLPDTVRNGVWCYRSTFCCIIFSIRGRLRLNDNRCRKAFPGVEASTDGSAWAPRPIVFVAAPGEELRKGERDLGGQFQEQRRRQELCQGGKGFRDEKVWRAMAPRNLHHGTEMLPVRKLPTFPVEQADSGPLGEILSGGPISPRQEKASQRASRDGGYIPREHYAQHADSDARRRDTHVHCRRRRW